MSVGNIKSKIEINRQDTYTRNLKLKDSDGNLIKDDWSWAFTVRESIPDTSVSDDSGAKISKTGTFTDGTATLELTKTETNIDPGTYVFDFQLTKTDGSIYSTRTGNFIILGDTTRAT